MKPMIDKIPEEETRGNSPRVEEGDSEMKERVSEMLPQIYS